MPRMPRMPKIKDLKKSNFFSPQRTQRKNANQGTKIHKERLATKEVRRKGSEVRMKIACSTFIFCIPNGRLCGEMLSPGFMHSLLHVLYTTHYPEGKLRWEEVT